MDGLDLQPVSEGSRVCLGLEGGTHRAKDHGRKEALYEPELDRRQRWSGCMERSLLESTQSLLSATRQEKRGFQ